MTQDGEAKMLATLQAILHRIEAWEPPAPRPPRAPAPVNFPPESDAVKLSIALHVAIRTNFPNAKKPNYQVWAREIDRMLRLDGRKPEDVRATIAWVERSDFWFKVTLSAATLRRNYDKIRAAMSVSNRRSSAAPISAPEKSL